MAPDGQTVVRAAVQARLLGIRLLSIDARVVVGPATEPEPLTAYPARTAGLSSSDGHGDPDRGHPGAALADAVEVLAGLPVAKGAR